MQSLVRGRGYKNIPVKGGESCHEGIGHGVNVGFSVIPRSGPRFSALVPLEDEPIEDRGS